MKSLPQVPVKTPKEICDVVPVKTCEKFPVTKEKKVAKKVCEKKPY